MGQASPRPAALPVRVAVDDRLAAALVPYLEGALGWQVTHGDELPASLALVGVGGATVSDLPNLLLVREDDPPATVAALAIGATAVLRWPEDRDLLPGLADELLHRVGTTDRGTTTIRVGGSAGGVGTTTVTLGLGGLLAWHGQATLVVASGDVPVPDVRRLEPEALAAHRTWEAATPVAGVPLLRVVATLAGVRAPVTVPDGTLVLRDDGVTTDVDLLVCARDRAGLVALDETTAPVAVVVGRGALPPHVWARRLPSHVRTLSVPWSERVARAGVVQRVPTSLPGRWLAAMSPLVRSLMAGPPDQW